MCAALLIREGDRKPKPDPVADAVRGRAGLHLKDPVLWVFVAAMVLLMPTISPRRLMSGPPELPGLIASLRAASQ